MKTKKCKSNHGVMAIIGDKYVCKICNHQEPIIEKIILKKYARSNKKQKIEKSNE